MKRDVPESFESSPGGAEGPVLLTAQMTMALLRAMSVLAGTSWISEDDFQIDPTMLALRAIASGAAVVVPAPAVQRETGAAEPVVWVNNYVLSQLMLPSEFDIEMRTDLHSKRYDTATIPLYASPPPAADHGELLREYDEWRSKPVVYTEEKNDWLKRLAAALRGVGR